MLVRFASGEGPGRPSATVIMTIRDDTTTRFSTGSCGYNANGKVVLNGRQYQVACNLVAIGSKNETDVRLEAIELYTGETRAASGAILGEATDE